jgi:cytochrome c-type biogenesis protein CcmF
MPHQIRRTDKRKMTNIGGLTLWMALACAGLSFLSYAVLHLRHDNAAARKAGRFSFFGLACCLTGASALLMVFILNHEFSYRYIAQYSSRDLPLQYLVSSFWAGQEGSFLLWVLLASWLGIFLIYSAGQFEPEVMITYNLNILFLMLLLIKQSPFATLPAAPSDGQGMNILLQDPWMVIHPPVTFFGYAAFAVPFSFATAALWRRQYDQWIEPALPWVVLASVSLGAGIMIGGYWSYKVLGWGGYWGWDPVENASLLPWLTGLALMHGMILQRSLGKLRKTNFFLGAVSYILVIYCTFLTRSGVLSDFSVHSFADLGITGLLVVFIGVFMAMSLFFLFGRMNEIPVSGNGLAARCFSREFGIILAIIILCLSAIVTGLGTSVPLITKLTGNPSKVSTDFYNTANLPLAVVMLLLLSVVPQLRWGHNTIADRRPKFIGALAGAIIAAALTLVNGFPGVDILLLALFSGSAVGMNFQLTQKLIRKKVTLSAGAMTHMGLGLVFVGIVASSAYDRSEKAALSRDTTKEIMGYAITLLEPRAEVMGKDVCLSLPIKMKRGNEQFTAQPEIHSERGGNGQVKRFMRPHIQRGLLSDLYISPVEFTPGGNGSHSGDHIDLKRGEMLAFHDYEFTFERFDVSDMMGAGNSRHISVGADISVSYQGRAPVKIKPILSMNDKPDPKARVELPGPQKAFVTLAGVDANAKIVHLNYTGPGPEGRTGPEKKSASMVAEVSVKPGMTVLWLGVILILLGGCISLARRPPRKT